MLTGFANAIREASSHPGTFLLYTLGLFAAAMGIIMAIYYIAVCRKSEKTALKGFLVADVFLSCSGEEARQNGARYNLGGYIIDMQDPSSIINNRLDPRLSLAGRANRRMYSVGILLDRYRQQYAAAGFTGDASLELLDNVLYETDFCRNLGRLCQTDSGMLDISGNGGTVQYAQNPKNGQTLTVWGRLPGRPKDAFAEKTGCPVDTIGIQLRYFSGK